jgi:hypothetical protein
LAPPQMKSARLGARPPFLSLRAACAAQRHLLFAAGAHSRSAPPSLLCPRLRRRSKRADCAAPRPRCRRTPWASPASPLAAISAIAVPAASPAQRPGRPSYEPLAVDSSPRRLSPIARNDANAHAALEMFTRARFHRERGPLTLRAARSAVLLRALGPEASKPNPDRKRSPLQHRASRRLRSRAQLRRSSPLLRAS